MTLWFFYLTARARISFGKGTWASSAAAAAFVLFYEIGHFNLVITN